MYNQKNHVFDTFYNHKFGFHITGPRQDAFAEVFRLRPKVVKTLDFSVDVMRRIKQEIPDVFLIGRLFVHPQDYGQLSGGTAVDARRKGIAMAERILREEVNRERHHYKGRPLFNAWESLNEVFPEWSDDDTHKLFDEYQVAFGKKMLSAGFEPVAFNFGQGNGRGQQWLRLYPGTLETYTYLGFHEYDWPTMDRLHKIGLNGPNEPHNRVPIVGSGRGNDGMWRCLRYRRIMYEGIRQKFGDKHTAIITECGMTQGVWGGPSRDIGPWAKQLTVPRDIPGGVADTPIHADDYWKTLLWYNRELMKDDFVMGACLFVTGAAGLPEWETFEHLGAITDRIYAFQKLFDVDDLPTIITPDTPAITPIDPDTDETLDEESVVPDEKSQEPDSEATPEPDDNAPAAKSEWRYTFETGQGLGLLVCDIGIPGERIAITRPDGHRLEVVSGSKREYGVGGFETYAQKPGSYRIEFLDQQFELTLTGHFTRVNFQKVEPTAPLPEEEAKEFEEVVEDGSSPQTILPVDQPDTPTASEPVDAPPSSPETRPPLPPSVQTEWHYTFEIGQGLGLLVGDIGIPGERITIIKPDGRWEQVVSGSKGEHGIGGFEVYAHHPGSYLIEFMEQRFDLTLSGQFTRVTFRQNAPSVSPGGDQPVAAPSPSGPALAPAPGSDPSDSAEVFEDDKADERPSPLPVPDEAEDIPPPPSSSPVTAPAPEPRPVTTPAEPKQTGWHYRMEIGRGLGLLVGDMGVKGETVIIIRPDGRQERLTSGSKPEYGPGGFELYAQQPGTYRVQFLDQSFALQLNGQFTKVIFERRETSSPAVAVASTSVEVSPPPEPVSEPETSSGSNWFKVVLGFIMGLFKRK
ncbi:MAG: hypothetical protein KDJ65_12815 [Anaerolineae bacterium]|nr:hypothetical protein [Anaerolineae bacterium]